MVTPNPHELPFGAIEAGRTKFNCMIGTGPGDIRYEIRIPTRTPAETLGQASAFFRGYQATQGALRGIGIGTFGPVDLDPT